MMARFVPGLTVIDVTLVDAKTYGQQFVSTAGRVIVEVCYGAGPPTCLLASSSR
ncbi:MAG: hypothetical protein PSY12_13570 [bacterium]|nr:hypothetical protein [bacterium]